MAWVGFVLDFFDGPRPQLRRSGSTTARSGKRRRSRREYEEAPNPSMGRHADPCFFRPLTVIQRMGGVNHQSLTLSVISGRPPRLMRMGSWEAFLPGAWPRDALARRVDASGRGRDADYRRVESSHNPHNPHRCARRAAPAAKFPQITRKKFTPTKFRAQVLPIAMLLTVGSPSLTDRAVVRSIRVRPSPRAPAGLCRSR